MKKILFIVICLALSGCGQKGVLFGELVDDEWIWFKNGDENTLSKYEGGIRKWQFAFNERQNTKILGA